MVVTTFCYGNIFRLREMKKDLLESHQDWLKKVTQELHESKETVATPISLCHDITSSGGYRPSSVDDSRISAEGFIRPVPKADRRYQIVKPQFTNCSARCSARAAITAGKRAQADAAASKTARQEAPLPRVALLPGKSSSNSRAKTPDAHSYRPQLSDVSQLIAKRVRPKSADPWQSFYERSKTIVPRTYLYRSLENIKNQLKECTFTPNIKRSDESLTIVHRLQRTHTNLANYFELRKRQSRRYIAATKAFHAPLIFHPLKPLPLPEFAPVEPQAGIENHIQRVALAEKFRKEREFVYRAPRPGVVYAELSVNRKPPRVEKSLFGPFPRMSGKALKN